MKYVNCKYNEGILKEKIDDIEIEYLEKYYICDECGSKIYGDLLDYNTSAANEKLREQTGLITRRELNEIPKKYGIGKKPLSLVLGLGEITLTRYFNGSNPTKENSELLKNILNNPFYYEMYLEVNKDKVSSVAYKKSLGKTKQIELSSGKSKLYDVALYIISKLKEVDTLSLQKLLYFANGLSKKFFNNNVINEESESWKYGPVYKDIYDCFSYYGYNKINLEELTKNRELRINDKEKEYLDKIIECFGYYSGSILREMSHLTDPWINTRIGLKGDEPSKRKITLEEMNNYFDKVIKEYNIKDLNDIKKYSDDLFEKAKKEISKSIH